MQLRVEVCLAMSLASENSVQLKGYPSSGTFVELVGLREEVRAGIERVREGFGRLSSILGLEGFLSQRRRKREEETQGK